MNNFKLSLPSKKEIEDLIKRGIIDIENLTMSDYSVNKNMEYTNICTSDYNDKSVLVCYSYPHFETDANYMPYITHYSNRFKRCNIKKNPNLGILPIIKLRPDQIPEFIGISSNINGKKVVRFGKFESRILSNLEKEKLESELRNGNVVNCNYYLYGKNPNVYADVYVYKEKTYVERFDADKVYWAERKDLKWVIDEEGCKLVCLDIIDNLNGTNVYDQLENFNFRFSGNKLLTSEEKFLLTPNERENSLPFKVFNTSIYPWLNEKYELSADLYGFSDNVFSNVYATSKDKIKSIRPCIDYTYIKDKSILMGSYIDHDEVFYGEYPQIYADDEKNELEAKYQEKKLDATGKVYTTCYINFENGFELIKHIEYEYLGNKYIRIKRDEDVKWIKVCPIKWLVDKETNLAIAQIPLISFIIDKSFNVSLEYTDINNYLQKYLSKEIELSKTMREKLEKSVNDIMLQIIMKKYKLSNDDVGFDRNGKPYIRSMSK